MAGGPACAADSSGIWQLSAAACGGRPRQWQDQETYQACAPEYASCIGRARLLAQLDRQVLIYEVSDERRGTFNWEELLQLYNGGSFSIRPKNGLAVQVQFRGALALCGDTPTTNALKQRLIRVDLPGFHPSPLTSASVDALAQVSASQADTFRRLAKQHEWEIFDILGTGILAYSAAQSSEYGDEVSPRKIYNYSQIMALVDCLCLMVNLPAQQRERVLREFQDMLIFETLPY